MTDYRAVAVTAKQHVELVPVDAPAKLGADEVRGRTLATAISPGTELAFAYQSERCPKYPGYAAVFEVELVGADVEGVAPGDVRFCKGPHRSFQQIQAVDTVAVPPGMPPAKAAVARLAGVSMTTLMTTKARPGDTVIVTGLGPVGFLAAQLFRIGGYEVIAVEPNERRRGFAARAGIADVRAAFPAADAAVKGKVALVAECSGHEQAVLAACKVVRPRGEVVLIGVPSRARAELPARDVLWEVFHNYSVVRSGWEWAVPHHASPHNPHGNFGGFAKALRWLDEGRIQVEGLIDLHDPRDCQRVYQDLLHGRAAGLFAVLDWTRLGQA
ncbi:MAG TPA: zinc-binding dehydrogenase [Phycisphaerae bacterium]|nr:zinc-binding dehydrogenase [Phycisphaerae bacterium]